MNIFQTAEYKQHFLKEMKLQRQDQTCPRRSNFLSKEIVERVGSDVGRKPSHSFIAIEYIWYFIPVMLTIAQ